MGVFQNNLMGAAAAAASAGGNFYSYEIDNSCRFDGSSSELDRTPGSAGNRRTFTFSTWIKKVKNGVQQCFFSAGGGWSDFEFDSSDRLSGHLYNGGTSFQSTGVFRDPSAWYHFVVIMDTTQGTADDRCKVYINGERITAWNTDPASTITQNYDWDFNNSVKHAIGYEHSGRRYFNGYLADTYMVDGTAKAIGDCGTTKNGVWIPDDPSGFTFGTNGFLVDYASSSDLGNDVSGNNNDFSASGLSAHDQMLDSPTNNFPTFNPLTFNAAAQAPTTEANCMMKGADVVAKSGNPEQGNLCTMGVRSGKWYWEVKLSGGGATTSGRGWSIGISSTPDLNYSMVPSGGPRAGRYDNGYAYSGYSGTGIYHDNSITSYGSAPANNDIIGMALDLSTPGSGSLTVYKNGSSLGVAVNGSIANAQWIPYVGLQGGLPDGYDATVNFGQDGTFAGLETAQGNSDANGYGNFYYSVPTGYLAMCSQNLTIDDAIDPAKTDDDYPQKLFSATTYSGNGSASARNIDTGIASDFVWIKRRNADSTDHMLYDSSRGVGKYLRSNQSNAEDTSGTSLSAFNSDGFQLSDNGTFLNASGGTYISYNWRANGGSASNSDGATSSTVQASPGGAFSIVTYTGFAGASGTSTVGHGMGIAPNLIIFKSRTRSSAWWTAVPGVLSSQSHFLQLNATNTPLDLSSYGTISAPTTSVFSINGVDGIGGESANYVAYCFANVEGFCQVGTYKGNGDDDGAFTYTGFRPAVILIREYGAADNWLLYNNKTLGYNNDSAGNAQVYPDTNVDEENQASRAIDILSNGFKIRTSNATGNASDGDYVYLALAHNPFKYATAR